MMAEIMKSLELHYLMIQFLISCDTCLQHNNRCFIEFTSVISCHGHSFWTMKQKADVVCSKIRQVLCGWKGLQIIFFFCRFGNNRLIKLFLFGSLRTYRGPHLKIDVWSLSNQRTNKALLNNYKKINNSIVIRSLVDFQHSLRQPLIKIFPLWRNRLKIILSKKCLLSVLKRKVNIGFRNSFSMR